MDYKRKGCVITNSCILIREICEPILSGKHNIYTIGQLKHDQINVLIKEKNTIWINIREEPTIYVNGEPYVLREKSDPLKEITFYTGISYKNIEEMEERMKNEINTEVNINSKLLVHYIENKEIKEEYITVNEILTSREIFSGSKIKYYRVPFSSYGFLIESKSLSQLFEIASRFDKFIFIINSDDERGIWIQTFIHLSINDNKERTQIGNNIEDISDELYYKLFSIDSKSNHSQITSLLKIGLKGNYRVIYYFLDKLTFRAGKESLDSIIDIYSENKNPKIGIIENIIENSRISINNAVISLEWYITLILFCEFLYVKQFDKSIKFDFIGWIFENPQYLEIYHYIRKKEPKNELFSPLNTFSLPYTGFKNILEKGEYSVLVESKMEEYEPKGTCSIKITSQLNLKNYLLKNKFNNILLLNLREEPCVYIGSQLYLLRDYEKIKKNPTYLRGISAEKVESIEEKLKENLIKELKICNRLVVYKEDKLECNYLYGISESNILTPKEYLNNFNEFINFIRFPITSSLSFKFKMFDKLFQIIENFYLNGNKKVVFLQSHGKGGRSCYIAISIHLILIYMGIEPHIPDIIPKFHFKIIQSLVRVLAHGIESKKRVDYLFIYYFGEPIIDFIKKSSSTKVFLRTLKKYFVLICFNSFLMSNKNKKLGFEKWILGRPELIRMYEQISTCNNKSELYLETTKRDLKFYTELLNRNGEVLNTMTILKYDYFCGSLRFIAEENPFARNFRRIYINGNIIAGIAMPTEKAIQDTIKLLRSKSVTFINWFNLREEPVLYINDKSYTLIHTEKINNNIENTGVNKEGINEMEIKLRYDIIREISKDKSRLLVHEEIKRGEKDITEGKYIKVKTLQTTEEVFKKYDLIYHRIPMTDEKAPIPVIVDELYKTIEFIKKPSAFIFNCQMGKGRTTTAMVIAYLILSKEDYENVENLTFVPPKYKIIEKLLQIIPFPEKSKKVIDFIIDKLDHMENLREIIDKYMEKGYDPSDDLKDKGERFLLRYYFLISFGSFIFEGKYKTFYDFLNCRPEIMALSQIKCD
ncbi:Paladin [Astathelohania contejeani]|uniref:Paladin n=1 Tax=Astathelohania contejeani TaxID=164912 RepID=A0ABQ7HWJ2_9MICR|nr:Paladin [Thelohania contejeani]